MSSFISSSYNHLTVNNISPDGSGNISVNIGDIPGLINAISGESGDSTKNISNTITYYVDSKYTGSVTNGSIWYPYTKIQDALNAIGTDYEATLDAYGSPTSNSDIHIHDTFCVNVEHGNTSL